MEVRHSKNIMDYPYTIYKEKKFLHGDLLSPLKNIDKI